MDKFKIYQDVNNYFENVSLAIQALKANDLSLSHMFNGLGFSNPSVQYYMINNLNNNNVSLNESILIYKNHHDWLESWTSDDNLDDEIYCILNAPEDTDIYGSSDQHNEFG